MNLEVFETLVDAKAKRDLVRDEIVRAVRALENLPAELTALLRADEIAGEEFRDAVSLTDPVPAVPIRDYNKHAA